MRRAILLTGLLLLVMAVPSHSANPGGKGEADRDFACGGSCHGDPGLSQPSSAVFAFSTDREAAYVGGPISVTVTVSQMELSDLGLIGLFLLSDTHGVADTPQDAGWTILSNGDGGQTNYVETHVIDAEGGASITWSLLAPASEGDHMLHAAVHHGGGGDARMAVSDPFEITVGPVPENMPQMLPIWEPLNARGLGEESSLSLPVVNATAVTLEYTFDGGPIAAIDATLENNVWTAVLPASLSEIDLQYRIVMSNEEFTETTGWISVGDPEKAGFSADLTAVRLQSIALMFASLALCISVQRRMARPKAPGLGEPIQALVSADQTDILAASFGAPTLNMADPRRPEGWTDEQWTHYGTAHLEQNYGGVF